MFKRLSIAILAWFFFAPALAQPKIDIAGVVKDSLSADPLAGVIVQLSGSTLVDTTNEEGAFHLFSQGDPDTNSIVRRLNATTYGPSLRTIAGNVLQWHCPSPKKVTLTIITPQGRKAATVFDGIVQSGLISFNPPALSSGAYFYRLITPAAQYTVPFTVTDLNHRISNPQRITTQNNREITATAEAFSARVFATKSGFYVATAQLSSSQAQDVTIKILSIDDTPQMVEIPAAAQSFTMGSTHHSEMAMRTVSFEFNFKMDKTPVTQNDFRELMGFNPSGFSDDLNRPVENVTWFDAVLYCNERSKRDNLDTVYSYTAKVKTDNTVTALENLEIRDYETGYRLPTEAEWEYSYRGGTSAENYWGDEDIEQYAWYSENSGNTTQPVGHKLPNAYELYDMAGNVWEWCNDWHERYNNFAETDPIGPSTGTFRVRRGNSWESPPENMRATLRSSSTPATTRNTTGFRVVLPLQD